MAQYGRNDAGKVRAEVKAALAADGIDADRETLLIFQVLLAWEGNKAIEMGPYVGGGNHLSGTAWVYDDEKLDPRLLDSKRPGGYYGQPCSVGEFNSHYIGGVAHELGHAFGLPHDCQRQAERAKRGLSLMGGGNHSYGQQLRGEGPGSFLSDASAMLLAYSRPFAGEQKGARARPTCRLTSLDAAFRDGKIVLRGGVTADPPAFGIAAFNDWQKVDSDYDAVSWTCKIAESGKFELEIGEMRPGASQLRLRVCHTSGATSSFAFDYEVDREGRPNIDVFRYRLPLEEAVAAYASGDRSKARSLAAELQRRFADVPDVRRKAAHLVSLIEAKPPQPLAKVAPRDGSIPLCEAVFRAATTGWGPLVRNQVPVERPGLCFLQVDGRFFDEGLHAHAPSKCEVELDGRWSRFQAKCGLQDGHGGSVVFVVRGDGKELARSPQIKPRTIHALDVDIRRVKVLELVVENGGDGNNGDWGVWLEPRLQRQGKRER